MKRAKKRRQVNKVLVTPHLRNLYVRRSKKGAWTAQLIVDAQQQASKGRFATEAEAIAWGMAVDCLEGDRPKGEGMWAAFSQHHQIDALAYAIGSYNEISFYESDPI